MPSSPLVSVILPTYDRPEMLAHALQSALRQTYENIEVIIADDGTNPQTKAVAEAANDPRVRYRRNPTNLGEIRNNQAAYHAADGKYIANLHDDDFWMPTFLERLVPPLENHDEATLAFCDHYLATPDGTLDLEATDRNTQRWGRATLAAGLHQPFWKMALIEECVPVAMASVLRASALDPDDFRVEARASYDKWIAYLLCREGQAAYYCPDRLTAYRIHEGQESARPSLHWAKGELFCYQNWAADPRLSAIADELQELLHQRYIDVGKELIRLGETADARRHLWKPLAARVTRAFPLYVTGLLPRPLAQSILHVNDALRA